MATEGPPIFTSSPSTVRQKSASPGFRSPQQGASPLGSPFASPLSSPLGSPQPQNLAQLFKSSLLRQNSSSSRPGSAALRVAAAGAASSATKPGVPVVASHTVSAAQAALAATANASGPSNSAQARQSPTPNRSAVAASPSNLNRRARPSSSPVRRSPAAQNAVVATVPAGQAAQTAAAQAESKEAEEPPLDLFNADDLLSAPKPRPAWNQYKCARFDWSRVCRSSGFPFCALLALRAVCMQCMLLPCFCSWSLAHFRFSLLQSQTDDS